MSRATLTAMLAPGPEATLGPWADGVSDALLDGMVRRRPWDEPALLHPANPPDSSAMIVLLTATSALIIITIQMGRKHATRVG